MEASDIFDRPEGEAAELIDRTTLDFKINYLRGLAGSLLEVLLSFGGGRVLDRTKGLDLYEEVRRFEVELINCALWHTGGHQRRAARLLGLKATTLNTKIKQYGIPPGGARDTDAAPSPARQSQPEHVGATCRL